MLRELLTHSSLCFEFVELTLVYYIIRISPIDFNNFTCFFGYGKGKCFGPTNKNEFIIFCHIVSLVKFEDLNLKT